MKIYRAEIFNVLGFFHASADPVFYMQGIGFIRRLIAAVDCTAYSAASKIYVAILDATACSVARKDISCYRRSLFIDIKDCVFEASCTCAIDIASDVHAFIRIECP